MQEQEHRSSQVSTLFSKLQVVNRAQSVLRAKQAGWEEESRTLPPAHTEETSFTVLGFARGLED